MNSFVQYTNVSVLFINVIHSYTSLCQMNVLPTHSIKKLEAYKFKEN